MKRVRKIFTLIVILSTLLFIALITSKDSEFQKTIQKNNILIDQLKKQQEQWNFQKQTQQNTDISYNIEGYYEAQTIRKEYEGVFYGTTTCNTFIETAKDGNRLNIEIDHLNEQTQTKILNSTKENPVQLHVKNKPLEGKGVPDCFSFIDILEVK